MVKNSQAQRVKALVPLLPSFNWRTGLTGTPASNGLIDLHGQYLVIDDGKRLGVNISDYRNTYFTTSGYNGYAYECIDEEGIHQRIADITLEMSKEDYAKLPDFTVHDVSIELGPKARAQYEQMEKEFILEFENEVDLEVDNEAAKINKLLQISNGFVYTCTETKAWSPLHDQKLEALGDIIEEAAGEPILLAYNYRPDAAMIKKKFPYAVDITGTSTQQFNAIKDDFAAGRIKLLIGHPASMGHGIDGLQAGSHIIVWYGLPWSLENYLQTNERLHRTGQGQPVRAYRILSKSTMDLAVAEALSRKDSTQKTLRAAIKRYREELKYD
jgi:SNF2 family DNA or RNA helicase